MGSLTYQVITIGNGATDSGEIDLREHEIVGIQIATITGATFSFKGRATKEGASPPSAVAVVDQAGNAVSVTATDDRFICFDEEPLKNLSGIPWLTFVSAGAEAAARTIHLVLRRRI